MNDSEVILFFVTSLIGYTVIVFVYVAYVLFFNMKALYFLREAHKVILDHDDIEESKNITSDISVFVSSKAQVKAMLLIVFLTLATNLFAYLFALVPEAQTTPAWQPLYIMASIFTSYIMCTFNSYPELKHSINATCHAYALILQSYEYEKEYKDNNNNDSSDRF